MGKDKWTVDEYKAFLTDRGKSAEDVCYNVDEHDCCGSCQGCSDCAFARWIKGELKRKPSRQRMMNEIVDGVLLREKVDEWMKKRKELKIIKIV